MNENFFADILLFLFYVLLSHCFFRLSAFLYSMSFRNNDALWNHCEIVFAEIQMKQKNLKSVFWAPKPVYRSPKWPEYVTGGTLSLIFILTDPFLSIFLWVSAGVCFAYLQHIYWYSLFHATWEELTLIESSQQVCRNYKSVIFE